MIRLKDAELFKRLQRQFPLGIITACLGAAQHVRRFLSEAVECRALLKRTAEHATCESEKRGAR